MLKVAIFPFFFSTNTARTDYMIIDSLAANWTDGAFHTLTALAGESKQIGIGARTNNNPEPQDSLVTLALLDEAPGAKTGQ